jgi:hypothetical protein
VEDKMVTRRSVVVGVWDKVWLSALILSMAGALPGCSFLFVSPPPSNAGYAGSVRAIEPVRCTSSKAGPVVDTVIAGLEAVRTGVALAADDSAYKDFPISRGADIGLGIGLFSLFAASAAYGYVVTGNCVDANGGARYARPKYYRTESQDSESDSDSPPAPPPASLDRHH